MSRYGVGPGRRLRGRSGGLVFGDWGFRWWRNPLAQGRRPSRKVVGKAGHWVACSGGNPGLLRPEFPDQVADGGWTLDWLLPPLGMVAATGGLAQSSYRG